MAGLDANKVYLPAPDQSPTTGAVNTAATGTVAPTDAKTALPSTWTSSGYIGPDGLSMSISKSFTDILDWSQSMVRRALSNYTGRLSMSVMQIDEDSAKLMFGDSNVTHTAATSGSSAHGDQLKIAIGSDVPPVKSFCFNMKDGDARVRVYVPRGQVTEMGDVQFVPSAAHMIPITIDTYDDGTGHSIYVFYDDGKVLSA